MTTVPASNRLPPLQRDILVAVAALVVHGAGVGIDLSGIGVGAAGVLAGGVGLLLGHREVVGGCCWAGEVLVW